MTFLVANYEPLARRLAPRLGSMERAREALHDTYVRLNRETANLSEPERPQDYLVRMAMNVAHNRTRSESRMISGFDPEFLDDLTDEAPDPQRVAEGRSDLAAVMRALESLPSRRAAILRRSWLQARTLTEISKEFGLAERTIRYELMLAVRALHEATKEKSVAEMQKRLAKVSLKLKGSDNS